MIHLILAGGKNKRFQSKENFCKSLLPVKNTTLIGNLVTYKDIISFESTYIVVGDFKEDIKNSLSNYPQINYIIQDNGNTLIDGLLCAKDLNDHVFLTLSDEYCHEPHLTQMTNAIKENTIIIGYENIADLEAVKETYSFDIHEGLANNFIEKPSSPKNKFRGTGHIIFSKDVFKKFKEIKQSEIKTLADLLNLFSNNNVQIIPIEVSKKYFNINTESDFKELNGFLNG